MIKTLKYITITTLMLLLVPIAVVLSGWRWQPINMGSNIKLVFWITESATYPWIILTNIFLCSYFSFCLRFRLKSMLLLSVFLTSVLCFGQSVKSLLKNQVQSLRPYDVWISDNYSMQIRPYRDPQYSECQEELLQEKLYKGLSNNINIPPCLIHHWVSASKFSFPSGHTLFVTTWALLGAGLLWSRHCYCSVFILISWAVAVMASRLLLGMHWPRDLLAAIILSWLIATLATVLLHYIRGVSLNNIKK
ncbi:Phosphatidylglycerophosphatase B [Candidatus Erwinia haradaeae]|uniref:undecaprenyl-diphosphate phosphatase n=2 Tax=Candidatus Erwinia haradaeae TaxID=1922217 RepID=A0A451DK27_9GAMM|nr:Phosphatidylglycerophosphatase B [Candidatus Erwinia haradaeae]